MSLIISPSSEKLIELMQGFLQPKGLKPIHSIQVYLSNAETEFCGAVGFADGKNEPAHSDNQFKIASMSKTMTAVVILQLQEEGLLRVEDRIENHLEVVPFVKVKGLHYFQGKPYGDTLTIKQLLQHRSGLADIFTDTGLRFNINEYLNKKQEWNAEKLMKCYYRYKVNQKAHFIPGEGYYYSDVNYFLLGLIAETLAGKSLAQLFRARIFEPLEMQNTFFEYYEEPRWNGKVAHSFLGWMDVTRILNTSYDWAGGGVVATTRDLAVFMKALFAGTLFRNDTTLPMMIAAPCSLKPEQAGNYGMGIYRSVINGDIFYGHSGFWGSQMSYSPEKQLTFCGSINQVVAPKNTSAFVAELLNTFEEGSGKL